MLKKKIIIALLVSIIIGGSAFFFTRAPKHDYSFTAHSYVILKPTGEVDRLRARISKEEDVATINKMLSGTYWRVKNSDQVSESVDEIYIITPVYPADGKVDDYSSNEYLETNADGQPVLYGEGIQIVDTNKIVIRATESNAYTTLKKKGAPFDIELLDKMFEKSYAEEEKRVN